MDAGQEGIWPVFSHPVAVELGDFHDAFGYGLSDQGFDGTGHGVHPLA